MNGNMSLGRCCYKCVQAKLLKRSLDGTINSDLIHRWLWEKAKNGKLPGRRGRNQSTKDRRFLSQTDLMALKQKIHPQMWENVHSLLAHSRFYSSKMDWKKLRPMIHERIRQRAKDYPVRDMIPVAYDVLKAREVLREGVSALLRIIPIQACKWCFGFCEYPSTRHHLSMDSKFCPEVYIGDTGHLIRTCYGYQRRSKDQVHRWAAGKLNDILVPVEVFHLQHKFQNIIKHDQRFDFDRVPAVVELCCQAGAMVPDEILYSSSSSCSQSSGQGEVGMTCENLKSIAQTTLIAWERLRLGVKKLLLVYPAKVCKYCSEVHIGPSGHKARLCGVFKFEGWRGTHFWKKAEVDDLIPPKIVWHRRPQDPQVLLDSGRGFYGHAPALVELCAQAGARVPSSYFCMMKVNGL